MAIQKLHPPNFRMTIDLFSEISYQVVAKLEKTPIDAVAIQMSDYPAIVVSHRYNDMSKLIFNVLYELGWAYRASHG